MTATRTDIINQIIEALGDGGSREMAEQVFEALRDDGRIAYRDGAGLVLADGVDLIEVAAELL